MRRTSRMIIRASVLVLALLVLVVAGLALRLAWIELDVPYRLASSPVVRWWRCQGVGHPKLAGSATPWTLTYSWSGGMGPGDVRFELDSNGRATLTANEHLQPSPLVADYVVPGEQIARIAAAVDDSSLLCQPVVPREGYFVWDIGRFSVSVTSGDFSRVVFVDECYTVADPAALFQVQRALISMTPTLHESIAWGPYGYVSVPTEGICAGTEPRQSELLRTAPPHRPP